MSVATQHSPFAVGNKRLYESEENADHLQRLDSTAASHKRYRPRGSPAGVGRCFGDGAQHSSAYAVGHATHSAIRALFPEMSDKVIADVLAEYGDNIDAAIKHLTGLRLSAATSAAAAAGTPEQVPAAAGASQQQQQAGAEAATGPTNGQAQHQPTQQQPGQQQQPRSAEEWVDTVVHEMAAAKDIGDARARASRVLQAFEQAAVEHAKQQGSGSEQERQLRGQLAEALRENQLLKRAVAIQNARMQELSGKEAEVAQLRQAVEGYQQKVHALERQNYSLALHLKQATDGRDSMNGGGFKNPDIF